ncbi:MAG: hypothetical protein ACR2ND_11050 [Solirubrobacteraceae bacterium]
MAARAEDLTENDVIAAVSELLTAPVWTIQQRLAPTERRGHREGRQPRSPVARVAEVVVLSLADEYFSADTADAMVSGETGHKF